MSDWPDGQQHPDDMNAPQPGGCVADGALHTSNQSYAAGTAFAISYQSDLSAVTLENLAVFSVLEQYVNFPPYTQKISTHIAAENIANYANIIAPPGNA